MVKVNRSSRKVTDDRNVNSNDKSPGLRRSAREPSSRKQSTASPSNTRKSERLEKQTSSTPPVKNKSERTEKRVIASPLRRSDRGKKHTSSGSSGSRKLVEEPISSVLKSKKVKGESALKQGAVDVGQGSRDEREDSVIAGRKRKKMDARSYKAFFKQQRIRIVAVDDENPESQDKACQTNSHNNGDVDDELKRPDKFPLINNCSSAGPKLVEDKDDGIDESGRMDEVDNYVEVEESDSKRKLGLAEGEKASLNSIRVEEAPDDAATMRLDEPSMDLDEVEHVGCPSRKSVRRESIDFSCKDTLMDDKGLPSEKRMSTVNIDADNEDGFISHTSLLSGTNQDLDKQQGLGSINTACNNNLHGNPGPKDGGTCEAADLIENAGKNGHATILREETSSDADVDGNGSICIACKLGGTLRMCDAVGCNRYYHLCCLNPPLINAPLGVWHCPVCVKKIKLGLPSMSAVAESILDTREVEFSDAKGLQKQKQKQYHVKFKDLDQTHNQWVTETQLLLEAPQLLEKFSKKATITKLSEEQPVPHECTAYQLKSDSSKFVEFWVPVQISNVQLEQYCATLQSNSMALSSCSKADPTGTMRDILISNRKCCNHPYIVDPYLHSSIMKDLEPANSLDASIKASGKLHFLDLVLPEIKKRQLRVLILFQPMSGPTKDSASIGDILDDYIRLRFGEDTYERIDGGSLIPSKKQAALNNFNKKELGRFIFLLEYRACQPSIKLSSVDMIIIFDSDWNPSNDLRALQRININSHFEQIMVFRLYTSFTLEERSLRLAEDNVALDSKLQNPNRSTSDALLTWGASYLFNKLEEFHSTSVLNISSGEIFLNKVREEFLNLISHRHSTEATNSIITRARQISGNYTKNLPLPSVLNCQLPDGEQPHLFWKKLLEGRYPQWKYLSSSTPRQRKRAPFEDPSLKTSTANDIGKKRRKTANINNEPAASKPILGGGEADEADEGPADVYWSSAVRDETIACDMLQESLHSLLKSDVTKLCDILKLSEDVKIKVEAFLKFVIDNYRVTREPATTLQAFLISLCWIGSSLLQYQIDRKESFALAKECLNFSCKEEEVNSVCSKLEQAKERFLSHEENLKKHDATKDSLPAPQATCAQPLDPRLSDSVPLHMQRVKIEIVGSPHDQSANDERIFLDRGQVEDCNLFSGENSQSSKQMPSRCETEMEIHDEKIQKEIDMFNREWEEKRKALEKEYTVEKAFIRTVHTILAVRSGKLKELEENFANKLGEHKRQRDSHLKNFKAKLLAAKGQMEAHSNSSTSEVRAYKKLPLPGSQHGNQIVLSEANKKGACDSSDNVPSPSRNAKNLGSLDKVVHEIQPTLVVPAGITGTIPNSVGSGSSSNETTHCPDVPNSGSDAINAISSKLLGVMIDDQPNKVNSSNTPNNNVNVDGIALEELPGARNEKQLRVGSASNGADNIESTGSHISDKQVPETTIACVPAEGISGKQHENIPNNVPELVNSIGISVPANVHGTENAEGDASEMQMAADTARLDVPTQGIPEQQHEHIPKDVNDHVDSVGVGMPAADSDTEKANGGTVCPGISHAAENHDDSHSSSSSNSPTIAPQEKVPSLEQFVSPASDHSEPINMENQIDSRQMPYSEIQDKDIQGSPNCLAEVEVETLLRTDAAEVDQLNSEDALFEPDEEPHIQLPTSPPVAENQTNLPPTGELVHEPTCGEQVLLSDSGPPSQIAENHGNPSDIAVLQTRQDIEEHPPDVAMPLADDLPPLPSADRVDHQLTDELRSSSQNPEASPQFLQGSAEIQNQAAVRPGPNLPDIQRFDSHNLVATRMPNKSPAASDPLQAELERLYEVKDNVVKFHEETKLRLKSEHEKELAEMIAQINNKHEAKCRDAEMEFQLKKKEIDMNLNRVVMNKILAEAFRSKCQDLNPGPAGMQQVAQASLLQHLHQFSVQSSTRSSSGVVPSSPGQASGGQQASMLRQPRQMVHQAAARFSNTPGRSVSNINPVNPSSTVSGSPDNNRPINSSNIPSRPTSNMNPVTSSGTGRPAPNINSISPSNTSRPPPNINPITPSSMPSRPPLTINPITPSTGNLRAGGEIRRPAPHIRPFRPSASASPPDLPSFQQLVPSQHMPSSLPLNSATLPQASPGLPLPPTSANLYGLPPEITPSGLPATSSLPAVATTPPSRTTSNPPALASAATPPALPSRPPPLSEPLQAPPSQVSSQPQAMQLPSTNHVRLPSQQSQPGSLLANSSSIHQASTKPLLPRIPSVCTNHAGLYSASPMAESGGKPPSIPDDQGVSLSALDLLMDTDDETGGHQPTIVPPPPGLTPNIELDLPELNREGNGTAFVNLTSTPDVVCLSDDD